MSTDVVSTMRLPYRFARRHGVLLIGDGDALCVLARDAPPPQALVEVARTLGRALPVRIADSERFDTALAEAYGRLGDGDEALEDVAGADELEHLLDGDGLHADLLDSSDDAPVIRLLNGVIAEAVRARCSDIHMEPGEAGLRVRFRIDGVMRDRLTLPRRVAPFLTSRVKVMARLDIAEKRLPQDGRVSLSLGGNTLDLRVSVLPSHHGERVVMRILDQARGRLDLGSLGMPPHALSALRAVLSAPNGLILVTGPTGSGKTTTLYAALGLLNDRTRNILTIEDPVEYGIDGIGQTQVNLRTGLTFASGLRAILRQDPDIVMIGEIRDAETAAIAVQAGLTGHLVLTTVHTNSAAAALTRLHDFGVEPFLLASGLVAVVAQRLLRRLCPACRSRRGGEDWEAPGCPACAHTGHRGRLGLYEIIVPDPELRSMIHDRAPQVEIEARAFAAGRRLQDQAAGLAAAGEVSLAEMVRVLGPATGETGE